MTIIILLLHFFVILCLVSHSKSAFSLVCYRVAMPGHSSLVFLLAMDYILCKTYKYWSCVIIIRVISTIKKENETKQNESAKATASDIVLIILKLEIIDDCFTYMFYAKIFNQCLLRGSY